MALVWKQGQFGAEYAFLGRIQVGAVSWISARSSRSDGKSGHQFRSSLFSAAPDIPEGGEVWSEQEDAKKEAEDMAVAYADYIGRKVHGEEAWARVTRGL